MTSSTFKLVFKYQGSEVTAYCLRRSISKIPHTKVNFSIANTEFNWTFYELNGTIEPYSWFQLPADYDAVARVIAEALKADH